MIPHRPARLSFCSLFSPISLSISQRWYPQSAQHFSFCRYHVRFFHDKNSRRMDEKEKKKMIFSGRFWCTPSLARPGLVDWLFPCHFFMIFYLFFSAKRKRIISQCLSMTSKWSSVACRWPPSWSTFCPIFCVWEEPNSKQRRRRWQQQHQKKMKEKYCAFIDSIKWRSFSEETQDAATTKLTSEERVEEDKKGTHTGTESKQELTIRIVMILFFKILFP